MGDNMRQTVYRCFDGKERLVYVGYSSNPDRRIKQHRAGSPWFHLVCKIDRLEFSTKSEALTEERRAISCEAPLCNRTGNKAQDAALTTSFKLPPMPITHHFAGAHDVVLTAITMVIGIRARLAESRKNEREIFSQARAIGISRSVLNAAINARSQSALGMV